MKSIFGGLIQALLVLSFAVSSTAAYAVSCMVVGEKTARVQTDQGEKSPVFLSNACEALRLVSGKAMVSWISRDGKPNFSPIETKGVSKLPSVGTEERSGNVVWAEMTSTREAARPAFMRALDEERPARIYIPSEGIAFPSTVGDTVTVKLLQDQSEKVLLQKKQTDANPIRLTREGLVPDGVFVVELAGSKKTERWPLKLVSDAEAVQIETQLATIKNTDVDESQRQILRAMLYEQLKLRVNMSLTLQASK